MKHVYMTHRGYVQISGKRRVGGAVQLLDHIPKQPISMSNQIVGIITPQPARAEMGGALLKTFISVLTKRMKTV